MRIGALIIILSIFFNAGLYSQIGGNSVFEFLNLTNSARVAALGGNLITVKDNDLNLAFHNPSLLNSSMDNYTVLNYVNYFAGISYGYVAYARDYGDKGTFAAGMHHINYGTFTEADPTGLITGSFTASEYALNLFWSKPLDTLWTVGFNLKPVYSVLESYTSFGIMADAGLTYYNSKSLMTVAMVVKNIGYQIVPYVEGNPEPVPFEFQMGASKRLKHAPFRFSLIANHLEQFDLTYDNPEDQDQQFDPISGEENKVSKFSELGDKVLRHLILSSEVLLTDNFFICMGYNFQRRKEMTIDTRTAFVGVSWGFGIKISKLHISYGRATYHLAGASNHFSLSTKISDFYKKAE